jgi:hypothetical protein
MEKKANNKRKTILIGLGVLGTGVAGFFGWHYWSNKKKAKQEEENSTQSDSTNFNIPAPKQNNYLPPKTTPKTTPSRNDEFPLQKGSKGAKVKALQEALISKYGKSIMPKYGADGDFGSELTNALKKLNISESIDESTYNVLTQGNIIEPTTISKKLHDSATAKNISQVVSTMKGMKNTDDYSAVSNDFKANYLINGVHQTLVNGMLNSFSDEKQKQQIRLEFLRMGLKYDGKKWALAGLGDIPTGKEIISTEKTTAYTAKGNGRIIIPENIVLGKKEFTLNGWVYFYPFKSMTLFKVKKEHIKIYKNEKSQKH